MKREQLDSSLFQASREGFQNSLLPNSLAIINPNDEYPRNGDQNYVYRQHSDLYYMTGIDQERTRLLIAPDFPEEKYREVLFIIKSDDKLETWEGPKLSIEEAKNVSGIDHVVWLDQFDAILGELMAHAEHVYLNSNEYPKYSNPVPYFDLRFAAELREKYPWHDYKRAAPILHELRKIKHPEERDLIRQACDITGMAFQRVMKMLKPGVMEYQVQAEISHEFAMKGANGHAYQPIIGSGERACILHYVKNDKPCQDGDLLLMDFGAEYSNYAADMSRTIPVNGKFSKRQLECYQAVLEVQWEASKLFVVGNTIDKVNKEVNRMMEQQMLKLGLFTSEEMKAQDPDRPLYTKYFMHGTSHFLGLDVHDVGSKYDSFQPGMVLTCEPGLYIKEEKMGIRIENDILVTKDGPVNLLENIPVEPGEIEEIMNS
jgi:Xaa-Pro aminopeptidase